MTEDQVSSEPIPNTDRPFSLSVDWLMSGWILEDPAGASEGPQVENFLIGGGARKALDLEGFEQASGAVWAPDFFPNHIEPFSTEWSHRISRATLLSWLSENFPGSTTVSKVLWRPPLKSSFERAFTRIQTAFREESVKKVVPAVFATGVTATNDRLEWLAHRLRSGLDQTKTTKLRLYGLWSESSGFLGATPEALFTIEGSKISSMAVAGTRTARLVESNAEALIREFENDPKERSEHELVASDIAAVFHSAGAVVERTKTRAEKFGALYHLVTDFIGTTNRVRSIAEWVHDFHPTPALGVSPRDPTFELLRETHALAGEEVARENFGAPFVVKHGDRVDAIVAIRQIRWSTTGKDDRLALTVGSGCGVVPESDPEREWNELSAKRSAVMRLFRLSPEESRPVFWSLEILEKLLAAGVRRFVVCAGARNAPLVVAVEALRNASTEVSETKVIVESFFEERAAAFYALGLSRALREPVAIVTTSGTAAAELLPAIAEADFSAVPLVAITADRPRRLRLSGAPQSIPQNQIFSAFVSHSWDLEEGDAFESVGDVDGPRPSHVNLCLEEPLLADAESAPELLNRAAREILKRVSSTRLEIDGSVMVSADNSLANAALATKLAEPRLVAIVGGLAFDEREAVASFLLGHAIPCLLEGTSGLRGDPRLASLELLSGDRSLQRMCLSGEVEHILRLGGVPTTRVWRDLDDVATITQTLSISKLRFAGLGRGQFIHLPLPGEFSSFLKGATPKIQRASRKNGEQWLREDRAAAEKTEVLLKKRPLSEAGFVRRLSELIPKGSLVYIGNSLPIRWWDLAATRTSSVAVEANRGVNGIDGQISTAFGLAAGSSAKELWVLVGDLTALYDLSAPWALHYGALAKTTLKVRVVVLNNSGGRIFKRVLAKAPGGSAPFENAHTLEFKNWAAMWDLGYARVMNQDELENVGQLRDRAVIEIVPSSDETAEFWAELP